MPGVASGLPPETLSLAYLVAAVLFVHGLRQLTHPRTARRGNLYSAAGMAVAVGATLLRFEILSPVVLFAGLLVGAAIGTWLAVTVDTTAMPQLVGLFNGFGGGASALVAGAELIDVLGAPGGTAAPVETTTAAAATGLVGGVTFWGSLVAAGKLQGLVEGASRHPGENALKAALLGVAVLAGATLVLGGDATPFPVATWVPAYWVVVAAASVLGVLLVVPIGGADMPVVIALLNALSGLAAAATGFALDNTVLVVAGALVGASGLILTNLMCQGMNRTLAAVLFGDHEAGGPSDDVADIYAGNVTSTSADEVAMLLDVARRVVVVPGYGMAVGQAQHAVAELAALLEANGVEVVFGIHPVAGRLPGHMNVLLAEADVPYEQMAELEAVNPTFSRTDVVVVVGANDVVNPTALSEEPSPIAGMPVLRVWDAQTVIVNKRSLSPGYAGIPNPLFTYDNTYMLFGDARETMQALVTAYEESHR